MQPFQMASIPISERLDRKTPVYAPCTLAASNAKLAALNAPRWPNFVPPPQLNRSQNSFAGSRSQTLQSGSLPFW